MLKGRKIKKVMDVNSDNKCHACYTHEYIYVKMHVLKVIIMKKKTDLSKSFLPNFDIYTVSNRYQRQADS